MVLHLHRRSRADRASAAPARFQRHGIAVIADLVHEAEGERLVYDFDANAPDTGIARLLRNLGAAGIDYKDLSTGAQQFIGSHGLSYPNLRDIDGSFAAAYGTDALPETFVLNRRLQVVAISRGEITEQSWLTQWIDAAARA